MSVGLVSCRWHYVHVSWLCVHPLMVTTSTDDIWWRSISVKPKSDHGGLCIPPAYEHDVVQSFVWHPPLFYVENKLIPSTLVICCCYTASVVWSGRCFPVDIYHSKKKWFVTVFTHPTWLLQTELIQQVLYTECVHLLFILLLLLLTDHS